MVIGGLEQDLHSLGMVQEDRIRKYIKNQLEGDQSMLKS